MDRKVLVTYATKYGSTTEIAEKIGEVLNQEGLAVDVLPAQKVRGLAPYSAVVAGSATYIGRWRKPAAKFLQKNQEALSKMPVWLFSSGPTEEGDPMELMEGWRFPKNLQPVADHIQPIDITVFHGVADLSKFNAIDAWMLKNVKASEGDFRDWEMISDWAISIAKELKQPA